MTKQANKITIGRGLEEEDARRRSDFRREESPLSLELALALACPSDLSEN